MTTVQTRPPTLVREVDGSAMEYHEVPVTGDRIERLTTEIFSDHWSKVTVGPLVPGGAWEIRFAAPPKVSMLDGYLTVDTGPWHFHLCVNDHKGTPSEALRQVRRVARAAFYRSLDPNEAPVSWGLRLWNGRGEQMTSVLFPNPHYDEQFKRLAEPRWEKLQLWDDLRRRYAE
jgi:hypothetical protein